MSSRRDGPYAIAIATMLSTPFRSQQEGRAMYIGGGVLVLIIIIIILVLIFR